MNWSSDDNIKITYRLLSVKGYGPVQTNRLLVSLSSTVSNSVQLEKEIERNLKPKELEFFERSFELYQHDNMVIYLSMLDQERYPSDLTEMLHQNSPTVLSCMGNLSLLRQKKIGFSGSRKVSNKGIWITEDCVSQLSEDNICIVSGYSNGVDLVAHRAALKNGASTIIILPEGISSFYIKKELQDVWDWEKVLVISEFMPRDKWMASRAMKRNLTIIGLSDAMVVVEAGTTGGSLDAGMKTIDAGKSLFVPKFKEIPESALGNELLLKRGAKSLMMKPKSKRTNIDGIRSQITTKAMHSLFV